MLGQTRGVGEQVNAGFGAAGVGREIAAHRVDVVHDGSGVIEQAFARRGELDAAGGRASTAQPRGPLIRALADASARMARSAPRVMRARVRKPR